MKAFTNTILTKKELVTELKKHMKLDNLIKGEYFNDETGKGCAVGCSIESANRLKGLSYDYNDHESYEKLLGLPEWFAIVQDTIFEELPDKESKLWPLRSMEAIKVGVNLKDIEVAFKIKIIESTFNDYDKEKYSDIYAAQLFIIDALLIGDRELLEIASYSASTVASVAATDYAYSTYSASTVSAYSASIAVSAASNSYRHSATSAAAAFSSIEKRQIELSNILIDLIEEL